MTFEMAKQQYKDLVDPPIKATRAWFRNRGQQLELIFKELLDHEELEPRIRFRPEGEEVDGSFCSLNRFFLVELKWHKKPIAASAIYTFKGKVDGKLVGTLGVFISMSGYSKAAEKAIQKGKEINIIFFDKNDIDMSFQTTFSKVLKDKLRAAADEGTPFFQTKTIQTSLPNQNSSPIDESILSTTPVKTETICFVCEGVSDQVILRDILAKTIARFMSKVRVRIIAAGGKYNLIKTAKSLPRDVGTRVFILCDADAQDIVNANIPKFSDFQVLVVKPDIEAEWLASSKNEIKRAAKVHADQGFVGSLEMELTRRAASIDLDDLRSRSEAYKKIYETIKVTKRY